MRRRSSNQPDCSRATVGGHRLVSPMMGLALAVCLTAAAACTNPPASDVDATTPSDAGSASAQQGGTGANGVSVVWLDNAERAGSVSHYRVAGQLTAPRSQSDGLRKLARDALADRARTLGFARLDNMQIEVACADDAPDASACTAKVIAIASH
ncbi:MAG: hypothetical protein GXP62_18630 [Oligoflexia bacterium]|nr:hypothetical protein [Oligoflexia bacterium]